MKITPLKHILYMFSIQHKPVSIDNLTLEKKYHIYCNFRNRVKEKNSDKYVDKGTKPCMLRTLRQGSLFDTEITNLVVIGSFEITYSGSDSTKEIGFTAKMRSADGNYYKLTVLLQQFTAILVQIFDEGFVTITITKTIPERVVFNLYKFLIFQEIIKYIKISFNIDKYKY